MVKFMDRLRNELHTSINIDDFDAQRNLLLGIAETIYSEKGPLASTTSPNAKVRFLHNLAMELSEVVSGYEMLLNFPSLTQSTPSKANRLSKADLVNFWHESYLNEYYIFLNRLLAFLRKIEKYYKRDSRFSRMPIVIKNMREFIYNENDAFLKNRGKHVHQTRFRNLILEGRRLSLLEELINFKHFHRLRPIYLKSLREFKKLSLNYIKSETKNAKIVLTVIFRVLTRIITRNNGIIYPDYLLKN